MGFNNLTSLKSKVIVAFVAFPPMHIDGRVIQTHSCIAVRTELRQLRLRLFRGIVFNLFDSRWQRKPKLHVIPSCANGAHKQTNWDMNSCHNISFHISCDGRRSLVDGKRSPTFLSSLRNGVNGFGLEAA